MKLFDIYESVALSPCAYTFLPSVMRNNMRVVADMYWPVLDLEPQWGTIIVGYTFIIDAHAGTKYSFTAGFNYKSNTDSTDLVVTAKESNQTQRGKTENIGKPFGNCALVLDRYNSNTNYPKSSALFSGSSYYAECPYSYSTNYEELYPSIIDTPTYDQNGIWCYGGSGTEVNSCIELMNNVSVSGVNCGKVKLYDVYIEEMDENTNTWNLIDKYVPCIYNDGSQNGVLGLVNRSKTKFSYIHDVAGTCSSYVENQLPPGPEDEFNDLFPNARIMSTNIFRYNNGESPVEAFRVFKTLEALQAFITAGKVYIGELISIVDDNLNNGVYQIVYGANDTLTYRKLKFK